MKNLNVSESNDNNEDLHTNFSTLALIVIKEARLNANLNQSFIANILGKTPSAWTKIENGQAQLTLDTFVGVCNATGMHPASFFSLIQNLSYLFAQRGCTLFYGNDDSDTLLPHVINFYNSKGFLNIRNNPIPPYHFTSIFHNSSNPPTIIGYCTDKEFRVWLDNGAKEKEYLYANKSASNKIASI